MAGGYPKALVKLNSRQRWFFQVRDAGGHPLHESEDFPCKADAMHAREQMVKAIARPRTSMTMDWCGWWRGTFLSTAGGTLFQTKPHTDRAKAAHELSHFLDAVKRAAYVTESA